MNPPPARHELTQRLPSTLNRTRDAIPDTPVDQRRPEPSENFRVHRPAPPRADDREARAEAARRQRHARRLDRWSEIRLAASACLALVATLVILVAGALVVGALLGEWPLPLR